MIYKKILEEAREREITKEEALFLFNESNREKFFPLLETASYVRDKNVGKKFKLWAHIPSTTSGCITIPACRYCWMSSSIKGMKTRNKSAAEPELIEIAKMAENIGFEGVQPGGGCTGRKGADAVRDAELIKSNTNLMVYSNYGYDMSEENIIRLKELGVERIGCQLEAFNPEVFKRIKPGDNLEERKQVLETIEKHDAGLDSGIMIGVGESYQDRVDAIFYLKKFKNLNRTSVCSFMPIPGTPMESRMPATTMDTAVTLAIVRLVFRNIDIEGSFGRDEQLQMWIMAGTNIRCIHGLFREKRIEKGFVKEPFKGKIVEINERFEFVNLLPYYIKMIEEAGLELTANLQVQA